MKFREFYIAMLADTRPVVFVRFNGVVISRPADHMYSNHNVTLHPMVSQWMKNLISQGFRIVIYSGANRSNTIKILRFHLGRPLFNKIKVLTQEQLGDPHKKQFTNDAQKFIMLGEAGAAVAVYFVDHEEITNLGVAILLKIEKFTDTQTILPFIHSQQAA